MGAARRGVRPDGARAAWGVLAVGLALCAGAHAGEPATDYVLHCQGCHLADGTGSPGAVPSLRGSLGRFLEVPGGRAYLVRVPGSAQSPLDDAALAGVLNWMVREFASPGSTPDFRPFDAAEVAHLRGDPLVDVDSLRRQLLREIARRAHGEAAR